LSRPSTDCAFTVATTFSSGYFIFVFPYRPSSADGAALRSRVAREPEPVLGLLDAARVDSSGDFRRARSTSSTIEREAATFSGLLIDAAEAASDVIIGLTDGTEHRGRLHSVGSDVITLRLPNGHRVLVPIRCIASLEAPGRRRPAGGDREPEDATLGSLLFDLAPLRPPVSIARSGAVAPVRGELWSSGADLCTIRTHERRLIHVRIDAITHVSVESDPTASEPNLTDSAW
jgi:hypothetical protein